MHNDLLRQVLAQEQKQDKLTLPRLLTGIAVFAAWAAAVVVVFNMYP